MGEINFIKEAIMHQKYVPADTRLQEVNENVAVVNASISP
jgi:hypothetical protein